MRCLSALVTEPQCYHCDVNSRLEKMHSTCVSNQMRSDMFVSKTWPSSHTSLNSMLKNVVNAVSAQGQAASIGEGCRCVISWVGIQFLKPCSQSAACRGPQRNRSLLSSLALELHKGPGSKVNLSLFSAFIAANSCRNSGLRPRTTWALRSKNKAFAPEAPRGPSSWPKRWPPIAALWRFIVHAP